MTNDFHKLGQQIGEKMVSYVQSSLEPIIKEISELRDFIKNLPTPKDGRDGVDGKDGQDGRDGQSVTVEDVRPVIEELVKSIEIPTPKDGRDGVDGKDGQDGRDGQSVTVEDVRPVIEELVKSIEIPTPKDGRDGFDGKDGQDGRDGVDGKDGQDGRDGFDGKDGQDGRDALDLEILPEINEAKTYAAHTYAYHNGGIWKAASRTNGMSGWECVVDGISDISIDFDEKRSFTISLSKSSGEVVTKTVKIPMVLDKGVYRADDQYEKGDGVTYGGSFWIAQNDQPKGLPGANDSGWRLAVKRGRDGRESVKIERQIDKVSI